MAAPYAQAVKAAGFSWPAKYGWFLAGWAYLNSWTGTTQAGMREISVEEWTATPAEYLLHPDHHPVLWGRVPGESTVDDARAALFAKAGAKDYSPAHPHAGAAGHH
ncbi:hypothetical protein HT031_003153 [Scenedesmus sp. PABB004]|nr:hypothetical protein HT031_003153 [Scenedesmus sp. PABB004]